MGSFAPPPLPNWDAGSGPGTQLPDAGYQTPPDEFKRFSQMVCYDHEEAILGKSCVFSRHRRRHLREEVGVSTMVQ